jgi:hypothetical protein
MSPYLSVPLSLHDELLGMGRRQFDLPAFRQFLSEEMVIPERLLTVETQFPYTSGIKLIIPSTHTIDRTR